MAEPSLADQIAEARRELGLRDGVYRKRVDSGRMTQAESDAKIALQKAIIASLERLKRYDDAARLL